MIYRQFFFWSFVEVIPFFLFHWIFYTCLFFYSISLSRVQMFADFLYDELFIEGQANTLRSIVPPIIFYLH